MVGCCGSGWHPWPRDDEQTIIHGRRYCTHLQDTINFVQDDRKNESETHHCALWDVQYTFELAILDLLCSILYTAPLVRGYSRLPLSGDDKDVALV